MDGWIVGVMPLRPSSAHRLEPFRFPVMIPENPLSQNHPFRRRAEMTCSDFGDFGDLGTRGQTMDLGCFSISTGRPLRCTPADGPDPSLARGASILYPATQRSDVVVVLSCFCVWC